MVLLELGFETNGMKDFWYQKVEGVCVLKLVLNVAVFKFDSVPLRRGDESAPVQRGNHAVHRPGGFVFTAPDVRRTDAVRRGVVYSRNHTFSLKLKA